MEIVIIGGSIAGLMHGVVLRSLGHNITIIEQAGHHRMSHMAGVCLAYDCREFLRRYDRISQPFWLWSNRVQVIGLSGVVYNYFKGPRWVTSWDVLYWRLRANFDGFASDFYPHPPSVEYEGAGKARFLAGCLLKDVEDEGERMRLEYKEVREGGQEVQLRADIVIAADGPNSTIRAHYLPQVERDWTGYVAWRGTVREDEISQATRDAFKINVTVTMTRKDHALMSVSPYIIPGERGSLDPGQRNMNFLWYTNETPASMKRIMQDSSGHIHRYIVPAAQVRPANWSELLQRQREIAPQHREVLNKIKSPFVQSITDFVAPRAAFAGGKVLLVGDALCLFRPHTASSGNQAAYHCLMVEKLVRREINVQQWEADVLRFSRLHWQRSVWYGNNYQGPLWTALPSGFKYWVLVISDLIRVLFTGQPSQLRY